MNNKLFKLLIAFIFAALVPLATYSQVSKKQYKERKRLLKTISAKRDSAIVMDNSKILGPEEFLSLSEDTIDYILLKKNEDNKKIIDCIEVTTKNYKDSLILANRKGIVKGYRQNELFCFFGNKEPKILFGDKSISVKEFFNLPEDTVAFVNYYISDFVKEYYPSKNKNGIIYVQPRATRSLIDYRKGIPIPSNGRNHIDEFGRSILPNFDEHSGMYAGGYIFEKIRENIGQFEADSKATIYVSCVINVDRSIKPILVERVESPNKVDNEQLEKMIAIVYEIIEKMPLWQYSGVGILYDNYTKDYYYDEREFAVTLRFYFP